MDNLAPEEKETLFYRELARYGVKRTDELTSDNWGVVARVFNKLGIKSKIPNFEDIIAAGKRKNSMLRQLNTRKQRGGVITYIWEAVNVVVDSLGGWKNIILAGTVVAMGFAFVNGDRQPVVYNAPRPSPPPRPTINVVNNTEDPQPMVPSPSRRGGYRKKRRQTKRKHRRH
jgi:hypothetical protein